MRALITKRLLATAHARDRPYEIRDTQVKGLLLRIQPSGHRAWVIEWSRGKRRTLGAIGHLTIDQARAHASQAMAEHIQEGLPSIARRERSSCSLASFLCEHYEPWARVELRGGSRYVERIRTVFASSLSRPLSDFTQAWVDRWWTDRLASVTRDGTYVTKATASRDLACLRSALSKAVAWGVADRNPLMDLRVKASNSRRVVRFLSPSEESRLRRALITRDHQIATARESANRWRRARGKTLLPGITPGAFGDHLTPLVLLAMNTGLRRGELLSLRWSDVEFDARVLTVRPECAKSGRQRFVPLNDEATTVLKKWRSQSIADDARLFGISEFKGSWANLLDAAGITSLRFHDLRHHFASKLVMAGVDLNSVRELLGHADLTMTLRYAHLAPEHLAAAVAKLNGGAKHATACSG
ncbi:tyrosine-type recombinase/integrase [Lysobacter sp. HA35]